MSVNKSVAFSFLVLIGAFLGISSARAEFTVKQIGSGFTFPDPNGGVCTVLGVNASAGGMRVKMGNGDTVGMPIDEGLTMINKCMSKASLVDKKKVVAELQKLGVDDSSEAQGDSFPSGGEGGSKKRSGGIST